MNDAAYITRVNGRPLSADGGKPMITSLAQGPPSTRRGPVLETTFLDRGQIVAVTIGGEKLYYMLSEPAQSVRARGEPLVLVRVDRMKPLEAEVWLEGVGDHQYLGRARRVRQDEAWPAEG